MYLTLFTGHFSTHLASSGHHFKVPLYNCNEGMCFPSPPCLVFFLKNGHSRPLFSLFSSFQYTVDSKQMFEHLPMTRFEPRTIGIGSDHSTN